MIKNVFLDLDETIFDFKKAERIALTTTLSILGLEPTDEVLSRYSIINQEQWKRLERGEATREEILVKRFEILFLEKNIVCDPKVAKQTYEKELAKGHYFLPGAEEMLQNLSKKYNLYLASNGTKVVQDGRIKSSGIEKYFKNIFISEEIGYNKPAKEYFEICFSKIPDFKREESVIVGDSLTSDILGGINAKIHTIWYNSQKQEVTGEIVPEIEVNYLEDIEEVIEKFL